MIDHTGFDQQPIPEKDRPDRTREQRIADVLRATASKLSSEAFGLDASLRAERRHNLGLPGYNNIPNEIVERAHRARLLLNQLSGTGLVAEGTLVEIGYVPLTPDAEDHRCA